MLSIFNLNKRLFDINYTQEDLKEHNAVAAVIKNSEGKILIQDHKKYDFFTIPVGKCKDDETPIQGLKTEVFEECNIKIISQKLLLKKRFEYDRNGLNVIVNSHLFEVLKYSGIVKNMEPEKHRKIMFLTVEEIMKLPYLSDMTILYLETLGLKRLAKIK